MESRSTSEPSLIRFSHVQLNYAAISWPEDTHCPHTDTTKGTGADQALGRGGRLHPSTLRFRAKYIVNAFFFFSPQSKKAKATKDKESVAVAEQ